jgi:type VI secretion system protein VasG
VRDENLKQIVRLKLGKIQRRLRETQRVALVYGEELVNAVAARCTEVESGARNVDNILTNTMLPEVSILLLEAIAGGTRPGAVRVSVNENGDFAYEVTPTARDAHFSLAEPADASVDASVVASAT